MVHNGNLCFVRCVHTCVFCVDDFRTNKYLTRRKGKIRRDWKKQRERDRDRDRWRTLDKRLFKTLNCCACNTYSFKFLIWVKLWSKSSLASKIASQPFKRINDDGNGGDDGDTYYTTTTAVFVVVVVIVVLVANAATATTTVTATA